MKTMKNVSILITLIMVLISCNNENNNPQEPTTLSGKWDWEITNGGINNSIQETPTSTEKNYQLYLKENGEFSLSENNVVISSGTYQLTLDNSIYSEELVEFISYTGNFPQLDYITVDGVITINQDNKLIISDNNHDGITSVFKKVKLY